MDFEVSLFESCFNLVLKQDINQGITEIFLRKGSFCVNQKYERVFLYSPLEEFYYSTRKKVCKAMKEIDGSEKVWN